MSTGRPEWWERADALHRAIVSMRSGGRLEPYSMVDAEMLALALAGEVGEVAQLFYKRDRDKMGLEFRQALIKELADVRIYLELLFRFVQAGDEEVSMKLTEVEERWRKKGLVF